MEGPLTQQPLKVCRHCSVASRTEAESCPECGTPYRRRIWRWWLAIPIVALAFGAGFAGRKLIDDEPAGGVAGITVAEGDSVPLGVSQPELIDRLGGEEPQFTRERGEGEAAAACLYYGVSEPADSVWEFCFRQGELIRSEAVGGLRS